MQPYILKTLSFIKECLAVINEAGYLLNNCIDLLVTMNIESLHANIPQREAFSIIKKTLNTCIKPHQIPTSFILACANIETRRNYCIYKDSFLN